MRIAGLIFFVIAGLLSAIIGNYVLVFGSFAFAVGIYTNSISFFECIVFLAIYIPFITLLDLLADLPRWVNYLVVALAGFIVVFKRISLLVSLIIQLIFPFISIAVHIFTIIFVVINAEWWKAIITAFLPGFAQIYWAIVEWHNIGFRESYFTSVLLCYIFIIILKYILLFYGTYLSKKAVQEDSYKG